MQIFNAHTEPPSDLLCEHMALTPVAKLLTTTARNYALEAALDELQHRYSFLFSTTAAIKQQQPKE